MHIPSINRIIYPIQEKDKILFSQLHATILDHAQGQIKGYMIWVFTL